MAVTGKAILDSHGKWILPNDTSGNTAPDGKGGVDSGCCCGKCGKCAAAWDCPHDITNPHECNVHCCARATLVGVNMIGSGCYPGPGFCDSDGNYQTGFIAGVPFPNSVGGFNLSSLTFDMDNISYGGTCPGFGCFGWDGLGAGTPDDCWWSGLSGCPGPNGEDFTIDSIATINKYGEFFGQPNPDNDCQDFGFIEVGTTKVNANLTRLAGGSWQLVVTLNAAHIANNWPGDWILFYGTGGGGCDGSFTISNQLTGTLLQTCFLPPTICTQGDGSVPATNDLYYLVAGTGGSAVVSFPSQCCC